MWFATKTPTRAASRIARPLAIVVLLAWWAACWLLTGIWWDKGAAQVHDDARLRAEQFFSASLAGYERIIATRRGMIRVLARDPSYGLALSRHSLPSAAGGEDERRRRWNADPGLAQVSRQLATAARDFGLRAIWLMDANGDCIASSNAGEPRDNIGTRYADRDYFQAALAGRSAHQVNIGRRHPGASIRFSAPVTDPSGRVIGVLAGGNDLSTFANWLDQADAFFTDRHGVVVLAKDPAMFLRALPNAPAHSMDAATRQNLYKTSDLPTLSLPSQRDTHFPELLRHTDGTDPVMHGSRSVAEGELVLHVLQPLPQLTDLGRRRAIYVGAFGIGGSLLVLLAAAAILYRRQRRASLFALAEREQRVAQARNFLDQIVNAIADPLFVKDHEHRWVHVNQAFCKFHGQPRENFIGKLAHEVFPQPLARRILETDERVLSSGIESITEEKLTDSEGVTHIVVIKKSPCTDAEGRQFVVGIISDITERKQVERLMRARERDFRTLAENAPDNIVRYDREGRIVYCNRRLEATLGATAADLIGNRSSKNILGVHFEAYVQKLERVLSSGEEDEIEVVLSGGADGVPLIHQVRLVAERGENGEVCGALAIGRDITEHRRVEEALALREQEFRGLAENLPVAVIRYDAGCRRRYLNRSARRMLQGNTNELLGLVPGGGGIPASPAMIALYRGQMEEVLATDTARELDFALDALPPDQQKHYEVRFEPEHGADGRAIGVLAIWYEVTERKRMESALLASEVQSSTYASLLQTVVESSPQIIIFALDHDYCYLAFNELHRNTMRMIWGQEIAVGMCMLDVIGQYSDREKARQGFDRALAGESFITEDAYGDEALSRQYWQTYWSPIRGEDGAANGLTCFVLNITERKRMEADINARAQELMTSQEQLKLTEAWYRSILRCAPDGMLVMDENGFIVQANAQIEALFGYEEKELIGSSVERLLPVAIRDMHVKKRIEFVASGRVDRPMAPALQLLALRKNGSEFPVDISLSRLPDSTGRVGAVCAAIRDVTERRRMEVELARREDEFRTLAENSPDAICRYDRDGRRLYINPVLGKMIGKPVEELIGSTPADGAILVSEQGRKLMEAVRQVFDRGEPSHIDVDFLAPDGQHRDYDMLLVPERDAGGQVLTVLTISRDISAIRDAERHMTRFLGNVPAFAFSFCMSPDGHFSFPFVSPGIKKLYGLHPDEVKEDIAPLHALAHPEDAPRIENIIAESARTMSELQVEFRVQRPGCPECWVECRSTPEREADGRILWHGIMLDITERKRLENALHAREQEFRALVENSPDAVFRYDLNCRRVYLNPAVERIMGVQAATLLGKTPIEGAIDNVALGEKQLTCVQWVLASGTPTETELTWVQADGTSRHFHMHYVPEYGLDGRVSSALAVGRDISALKQVEERLRKSRDVVRALAVHQETEHEKERRRLAYEIHEDLAQNLTALRMNISLIEMGVGFAPGARLPQTMHAIVDRSIAQIRQIVLMLRPTVLDSGLVPALQWITDDFKGVGFQFDVALQEDILLSDEVSTFLFRVAQEALLNIALHAGATHVRVLLDGVAGGCRLLVRDNGCGFDPGAPRSKDSFGLIRLAEQARHLGGDLFIDSAPGQGATLVIQLPG